MIGLTQSRWVSVASALWRRKTHAHRIHYTGLQGPEGVEFIEVQKRDSTFTYVGPSEKLYFVHELIHERPGFVKQSLMM